MRMMLGDPERDVTTARMSDQVHRSCTELAEESCRIIDMLLDREAATGSVPPLWPEMPHADCDHSEVAAERLHLVSPKAQIEKRAVNKDEWNSGPLLQKSQIVSINVQGVHSSVLPQTVISASIALALGRVNPSDQP